MTRKLVIRFRGRSVERVDWMLFDPAVDLNQTYSDSSLSDIPIPDGEYEVWAVVPGSSVLLTAVELPQVSRGKILKAVPYAIENQLATEIDELHFALGNRNDDGLLNVACVDRKELQEWLCALTDAGFSAKVMLPDNLLLPLKDDGWSVLLDGDAALVRSGLQAGFAVDTVNLDEIAKLYGVDSLAISKEKGDYFTRIVNALKEPAAINLLQGEYRVVTRFEQLNNIWRLAITLAVAWILVLFLGHGAKFTYLKIKQHQQRGKMVQLYRQVFPAATTMNNPKLELQGELNKYQGTTGSYTFLYMLAQTGRVISVTPAVSLQRVTLMASGMEIVLRANNFAAIDQFMRRIMATGLHAKREEASSKDKFVLATIKLGARL